MSQDTRERKLPLRLIGVVIALVAIAAIGYALNRDAKANDRFLLGAIPVDDHRALVAYRMDYDRDTPHWRLALIDDAKPGPRWEAELPSGVFDSPTEPNLVVDLESRRAFTVADRVDGVSVNAFDSSDGASAWQKDFPARDRGRAIGGELRYGKLFVVVGDVIGDGVLTALDPKTGDTVFEIPDIDSRSEIFFEPTRLVVQTGATYDFFDTGTGALVDTLKANHTSCRVGDAVYWLQSPDSSEEVALFQLSAGDEQPSASSHKLPQRSVRLPDRCATSGDLIIFTSRTSIVALDRESGEQRWELAIARGDFSDMATRGAMAHDLMTLDGEITPFVPLFLRDGEKHRWAILDVRSGELLGEETWSNTWSEEGHNEFLPTAFRIGSTWIITLDMPGSTVTVGLNGQEGTISRAFEMADTSILPKSTDGATIWTAATSTWTRSDNMAWYKLDALTLASTGRGNAELSLTDVTDKAKARFGL